MRSLALLIDVNSAYGLLVLTSYADPKQRMLKPIASSAGTTTAATTPSASVLYDTSKPSRRSKMLALITGCTVLIEPIAAIVTEYGVPNLSGDRHRLHELASALLRLPSIVFDDPPEERAGMGYHYRLSFTILPDWYSTGYANGRDTDAVAKLQAEMDASADAAANAAGAVGGRNSIVWHEHAMSNTRIMREKLVALAAVIAAPAPYAMAQQPFGKLSASGKVSHEGWKQEDYDRYHVVRLYRELFQNRNERYTALRLKPAPAPAVDAKAGDSAPKKWLSRRELNSRAGPPIGPPHPTPFTTLKELKSGDELIAHLRRCRPEPYWGKQHTWSDAALDSACHALLDFVNDATAEADGNADQSLLLSFWSIGCSDDGTNFSRARIVIEPYCAAHAQRLVDDTAPAAFDAVPAVQRPPPSAMPVPFAPIIIIEMHVDSLAHNGRRF